MPSIQDVADQINAKLDQITVNTGATAANTADIRSQMVQANSRLDMIDTTLNAGFANLSHGLFLVTELQKVSILLLDHHRQQNDTIICLIENTNDLLCGITRKITQQLEISDDTRRLVDRLEGVSSRVHASEAGDYDRHQALQDQIEECCPPEQQPLEPCPEACPRPGFKPVKPKGGDWAPLQRPKDSPKSGAETKIKPIG